MAATPSADFEKFVASRRAEFELHVWNHSEDIFQQSFDARRALNESELEIAVKIQAALREGVSDSQLATLLYEQLKVQPELIYPMMQIVGLTRNKILQDLKASLANTGLSIPSSANRLINNLDVWERAAEYLAKRLRIVLKPLTLLSQDAFIGACQALNQATWPGWIRQERAKRSGHEAEHRLAVLFWSLKIPFQPEEKVDNPLCPDLQYRDISFDLGLVSDGELIFGVKSTVHTSNIGQYGESKDALEMIEARSMMDKFSPAGLLIAMVDGVGFRSNRAGLDGVLAHSDEFCQFATIWKAAIIASSLVDIHLELWLEDPGNHQEFLNSYSHTVTLVSEPESLSDWIQAGESWIRRRQD